MFGTIEAGGAKFVCGIGTGPEDLMVIQVPTTTPEATAAEALAFFSAMMVVQSIVVLSMYPETKGVTPLLMATVPPETIALQYVATTAAQNLRKKHQHNQPRIFIAPPAAAP